MQLSYATYINASTSYSLSGLNFLREFVRLGVPVRLFPMDQPTPATNQFKEVVQTTHYQDNIPHHYKDAVSLRFAHSFDGFTHVNKRRVLYTVFEVDKLNSLEESSILSNDLVITSNNYHRDILHKYHPYVETVPLGVDHSLFNDRPGLRSEYCRQLNIPEDATLFFNCGKFERRKNHRELCEAFSLAFDPGDNTYLIMVSDNGHIKPEKNKEWVDYYKNSKMGSHIIFLQKNMTLSGISSLMKSIDCVVAPSRAEGFNLPALEALSCGKHLITTNITAMADYCSINNSHLVELSEKELAFDEPFFRGQGSWYKWTTKHTKQLAEMMNHIHTLKQNDELKPNINGVATAAGYSWENVSRQLVQTLEDFYG